MVDLNVFRTRRAILQNVLTNMPQGDLPKPPAALYHYSSLEVLQKILEFDDIRLSHAEFSNDHEEIETARALIFTHLKAAGTCFAGSVEAAFQAHAHDVDAYIFCMATGLPGSTKPQDMLRQWRAYAQDGRGGALTLESCKLAALAYYLPELRINPVIYNPCVQQKLIDRIIAAGGQHVQSAGEQTAIDATVASLVFTLPLMKHRGFDEEQEWRLIFMPPTFNVLKCLTLKFQPRRDFLVPFVELKQLWNEMRPYMLEILEGDDPPPSNVTEPSSSRLVPATGLMVGPSGHQELNVRAMEKVVAQCCREFTVCKSDTPYRSLS